MISLFAYLDDATDDPYGDPMYDPRIVMADEEAPAAVRRSAAWGRVARAANVALAVLLVLNLLLLEAPLRIETPAVAALVAALATLLVAERKSWRNPDGIR